MPTKVVSRLFWRIVAKFARKRLAKSGSWTVLLYSDEEIKIEVGQIGQGRIR